MPDPTVPTGEASSSVAGALLGAGSAEVPRRRLEPADILAIVRSEIAEREAVARDYESLGQEAHALALRDEAQVLERLWRRLNLG